jgi:hypothetical protein
MNKLMLILLLLVAAGNINAQTENPKFNKALDAELFQWYGSAALPLYLKYHDNVKKMNF